MGVILCYGDSNTWGFDIESWKAATPGGFVRFPPHIRWPGVLAAELGSAHRVIEEGLNGRTTVWDDPVEGEHKNGRRYLLACLESHAPIDTVVLALGINDVKERFAATAADIASGAARLAGIILGSDSGPGGRAPAVLLLAPFPLGEGIRSSPFGEMFGWERGLEKSRLLAARFEAEARALGIDFLDAGKIVQAHHFDSLHLSARSHRELGLAVAARLREGSTALV
ncbi:MAG: SGNH/GDSL hydrolase family protein [Rectinemataceae bacterium]|jgi:lysophospholipase L1-like esterase